jgi:acyl-CoA dehydrogenase
VEIRRLGDRHGGAANTAKIRSAEVCFTACDRALQTFGGMGSAVEMQVERHESCYARRGP